jgi:hypothetical protein
MPDADTVWLTTRQDMLTQLERAGLVVRWEQDHSRDHLAVAESLIAALTADAANITAQIGRRALEELLAAHRLWRGWRTAASGSSPSSRRRRDRAGKAGGSRGVCIIDAMRFGGAACL